MSQQTQHRQLAVHGLGAVQPTNQRSPAFLLPSAADALLQLLLKKSQEFGAALRTGDVAVSID